MFTRVCVYVYECERVCGYTTGWRRVIGCLISYITFRKLATDYRALLRKMTYPDKASYDSMPPCISEIQHTVLHTVICCSEKEQRKGKTFLRRGEKRASLPLIVMEWLRLVGSLKGQVSFAEYRLFHRTLLQKRPINLSIILLVATPYGVATCSKLHKIMGLFCKRALRK